MNVKNTILHLKKIRTHRRWVRRYCFMAGLYWQGLTHDLSKYSPTEFWESVKYYQGTSSPILACKKDKGYSMAWFHHLGRNKHHWEYWVEFRDDGSEYYVKMPMNYLKEMLCDWLSAGKTYNRSTWQSHYPLQYFMKHESYYKLHPETKAFALKVLHMFAERGEEETLSWLARQKDY